jgi:hypothetical protein
LINPLAERLELPRSQKGPVRILKVSFIGENMNLK